jgi:hypothetical protein
MDLSVAVNDPALLLEQGLGVKELEWFVAELYMPHSKCCPHHCRLWAARVILSAPLGTGNRHMI